MIEIVRGDYLREIELAAKRRSENAGKNLRDDCPRTKGMRRQRTNGTRIAVLHEREKRRELDEEQQKSEERADRRRDDRADADAGTLPRFPGKKNPDAEDADEQRLGMSAGGAKRGEENHQCRVAAGRPFHQTQSSCSESGADSAPGRARV